MILWPFSMSQSVCLPELNGNPFPGVTWQPINNPGGSIEGGLCDHPKLGNLNIPNRRVRHSCGLSLVDLVFNGFYQSTLKPMFFLRCQVEW